MRKPTHPLKTIASATLLVGMFWVPVGRAQPSVEILPTENVEELETPTPATADDLLVRLFAPRLQPGRNNEFANISITIAAINNIEVEVEIVPETGKAILSNTDVKQILSGTTGAFSGVATKGKGRILIKDASGNVIKEVAYAIGQRKSIRQSIGFNTSVSRQDSSGALTDTQAVRWGASDVKGNWSTNFSVQRSNQSTTGSSFGFSAGFNLNID